MKGSRKKMWVLEGVEWEQEKCAGANMGDMVMILFLCGRHNLGEAWATCIQGCEFVRATERMLRAEVQTVLWTTEQKHTTNWSDKHVLFKWKDRQETEQGNCTKALVRCVLAHAGNLQFRFHHDPFTKRFRPAVTRVPTVVLSMSRFSRLAVTRAWLFRTSDIQ